MKRKEQERLAKRGIKKGSKTLNKIIESDVLNSKTLKDINRYTNLLKTANEYLNKAFNG
jgi:hypothetical protein